MKKVLLAIAFALPTAYAMAQVGIGTSDPKTTLDVTAVKPTGNLETVEGILIPRVDRERAQSMRNIEKSTMIFVNNISTGTQENIAKNINAEGFYYFDGTVWVKLSSGNANPSFFYMPSVLLPTLISDERLNTPNSGYKFNNTEKVYEVDLYKLFKDQFGTPISVSNSQSNLNGFILEANEYDYFITFADKTVFNLGDGTNPSTVEISPEGILKYKILPEAIIRNGSFMNVVLKVK